MKASDILIANNLLKDVGRINQQLAAIRNGNLNGAQLSFGISTACDCPNLEDVADGNIPAVQLNLNHGSEHWGLVQSLAEILLEKQRLEILDLLTDMGVVVSA